MKIKTFPGKTYKIRFSSRWYLGGESVRSWLANAAFWIWLKTKLSLTGLFFNIVYSRKQAKRQNYNISHHYWKTRTTLHFERTSQVFHIKFHCWLVCWGENFVNWVKKLSTGSFSVPCKLALIFIPSLRTSIKSSRKKTATNHLRDKQTSNLQLQDNFHSAKQWKLFSFFFPLTLSSLGNDKVFSLSVELKKIQNSKCKTFRSTTTCSCSTCS